MLFSKPVESPVDKSFCVSYHHVELMQPPGFNVIDFKNMVVLFLKRFL